jgi:hypothetical protein
MGEVAEIKARLRQKLKAALNKPDAPPAGNDHADERPEIVYAPGNLPENVDQGEAAILAMPGQPRIYQRGGALVHIVRRGATSARRMTRAPGAVSIQIADPAHLVEVLTEAAIWLKPAKRKQGEDGVSVINCPHEIPNVLMARGQWKFPVLTAVLEAPTLRPDWSVLAEPGHDAATGLFLDLGATTFDPILTAPDRATSLVGVGGLLAMLDEFPFADPADKSVALAAILTGLVRPSLTAAPLFGMSATVPGSGKTYLAHVVSLLACGRAATTIAPPKDAKEEDKTLFAVLLEGDSVIVYDNIEHQLSSDWLCVALTAESMSGRVLGTSKNAAVSTACVFIATGNNLTVAGDLSARALVCCLDPKMDHPEHRPFKRDLTAWIPEHRGRLVSGALTFLRGYLTAEDKPVILPWQRFPDWDMLIRGAIVWANLPDPLLALRQGEKADPRRTEHEAILQAWTTAFGDQPTAVRTVVKQARELALLEQHQLLDALLDVAGERGEINLRRLGRWLGRMCGRIQGGMKIERGHVSCGMQTWRVVKADDHA